MSDSLTYVENTVIANNAFTGLYITGRVGGPTKYVTNTTISGNGGSGLYVYYYDYTLITNTSIWGNSGFGFESYAESQSFLMNTIIGGNLAGNCYNSYYLLDIGGNFTDDDTCLPGFDPITGFDPVLSDNGGSTLTHALLPGSPALDAGVNCSVAEDQRGYPRDVTCDAGSYELFCSLTVTRGSPDTLIDFTPASSPFDLVSGLLSELREDAGFARATCLGSFGTGPAVDPLPDPPTGDGRYYLARGVTSCPNAGFGVSTLTPDPRGALAAGPCP